MKEKNHGTVYGKTMEMITGSKEEGDYYKNYYSGGVGKGLVDGLANIGSYVGEKTNIKFLSNFCNSILYDDSLK